MKQTYISQPPTLIIGNQEPIFMDSVNTSSFGVFGLLKKKICEQIAPSTATIRREKVTYSPVSALAMDSSMPRNFTVSARGVGLIGPLVPEETILRLSHQKCTHLIINKSHTLISPRKIILHLNTSNTRISQLNPDMFYMSMFYSF